MIILGDIDMKGGALNSALLEGCSVSKTPERDNDIPNKKYVDDIAVGSDPFYAQPIVRIIHDAETQEKYLQIIHPLANDPTVSFVLMNKSKRHYKALNISKRGWTIARPYSRAAWSYKESSPSPFAFTPSKTPFSDLQGFIQKYYMYPRAVESSAGLSTIDASIGRLRFGWAHGYSGKHQKMTRMFGVACRRIKSNHEAEYSAVAKIWAHIPIDGDALGFGAE